MNRRLLAAGAALLVALTLAGCANEPLAQLEENGQGYVSGDGAITEIPAAKRDAPIEFTGTDENGKTISSADYAGQVYVVNFWFASCPPCRAEAPDLKALSEEYTEVPFLGVNIYDSKDVALTFAEKFEIGYPSILDTETAAVQLAFAGAVAPKAVPTTLILDREGRVAARINGLLNASNLSAMIDTVVAEGK